MSTSYGNLYKEFNGITYEIILEAYKTEISLTNPSLIKEDTDVKEENKKLIATDSILSIRI